MFNFLSGKKISLILFCDIGVLIIMPASAFAGYLTSPLTTYNATSWMDHTTPAYRNILDQFPGLMTKYDGTTGASYDGHAGTDLVALVGTPVIASAAGTISYAGYDDCGGNYIRIWHPDQGHSTYYFHLHDFVVNSGPVYRGQLIAHSGDSGDHMYCITGPHLHFEVRNGQPPAVPMDPYGWSGSGNDPWSFDQGYLWTTNPPSTNPPGT